MPLPLLKQITVGLHPIGVAIDPSETFVYVANSGSNSVSVISTSSNSVVTTLVGASYGFSTPWDLKVTPDGSTLYVANNGNQTVTAINLATQAVTQIPVATAHPTYLAITPNGKYVFVSSDLSTVTRINTTGAPNPTAVTVGNGAKGLVAVTTSPGVYAVYVANTTANTFSKIDAESLAVTPISVGAFGPPTFPAVTQNQQYILFSTSGAAVNRMKVSDSTFDIVTGSFGSPFGLAMSPATTLAPGGFALVPNAAGATNRVVNNTTISFPPSHPGAFDTFTGPSTGSNYVAIMQTTGKYAYVVTTNFNSPPGPLGVVSVYSLYPVLTSSSSSTGLTTGAAPITLTGSGFTGATAVHFGSTAALSFTVNSDSSITVTPPDHAPGPVTISVTNPYSTSTEAVTFTYQAPTTTTVTATPASSVCGEPVQVCATVAALGPGSGIPTGSVTFTEPGGLNQTVTLDATGKACFTSTTLTSGTLTAVYTPDASCFATSTGTVAVTVDAASTTTTV
ncbi:Ig-like domain repeat protein, partial [Streptomyces sioyaensis]|uniref:Ig-like domain repeat protein n=1 Tax=Streptomyces sioyaensis TaxID=67364 RepID=UPI0036F0CA5E